MARSKNRTADMFAPAPVMRMVSAKRLPSDGPWTGPGTEPHSYHPDAQAMGDCSVCGHIYSAHFIEEDVRQPK